MRWCDGRDRRRDSRLAFGGAGWRSPGLNRIPPGGAERCASGARQPGPARPNRQSRETQTATIYALCTLCRVECEKCVCVCRFRCAAITCGIRELIQFDTILNTIPTGRTAPPGDCSRECRNSGQVVGVCNRPTRGRCLSSCLSWQVSGLGHSRTLVFDWTTATSVVVLVFVRVRSRAVAPDGVHSAQWSYTSTSVESIRLSGDYNA